MTTSSDKTQRLPGLGAALVGMVVWFFSGLQCPPFYRNLQAGGLELSGPSTPQSVRTHNVCVWGGNVTQCDVWGGGDVLFRKVTAVGDLYWRPYWLSPSDWQM